MLKLADYFKVSVLAVKHSFICDCHSDWSAAADVHSSPDLHKDCQTDFWFSSSALCSTWALTHLNLTVGNVCSSGGWSDRLPSTGCCFERSRETNQEGFSGKHQSDRNSDITRPRDRYIPQIKSKYFLLYTGETNLDSFLNPCVCTCAMAHWVSLGNGWINDKLAQLSSAVPNRCYRTTALGLFLCIAKIIQKARDSELPLWTPPVMNIGKRYFALMQPRVQSLIMKMSGQVQSQLIFENGKK